MKSKIVIIMLSIMFIGCIWIIDASAQQPSYLMVCKGGGEMQAEINTVFKTITIHFYKSPLAASQQQPKSGTCAWADRPISPEEQRSLMYQYERTTGLIVWIRNKLMSLAPALDSNLNSLVDAVYNEKLFYVHCYHDRDRGHFMITRVGP
jgi:hypothetical protein